MFTFKKISPSASFLSGSQGLARGRAGRVSHAPASSLSAGSHRVTSVLCLATADPLQSLRPEPATTVLRPLPPTTVMLCTKLYCTQRQTEAVIKAGSMPAIVMMDKTWTETGIRSTYCREFCSHFSFIFDLILHMAQWHSPASGGSTLHITQLSWRRPEPWVEWATRSQSRRQGHSRAAHGVSLSNNNNSRLHRAEQTWRINLLRSNRKSRQWMYWNILPFNLYDGH